MNIPRAGWAGSTLPAPTFVAVLAAVLALSPGDNAGAATLSPSVTTCIDDAESIDVDPYVPGSEGECDGDASAGTPSAVTTVLNLEAPDSLPRELVLFTPPEWGVARDADVPDGKRVGTAARVQGIGFLGGSCVTPVNYAFNLLDATTERSDAVTFEEQFEVAAETPRGATEYPDYLSRIVVDGEGEPLEARARYYGQTSINGRLFSLNLLMLEPGTNYRGLDLAPEIGYPMVVIAGNERDPQVEPFPHSPPLFETDSCAPLRLFVNLTKDVRTNPVNDGDYAFATYASSRYDADGDGHDNYIDTCPFAASPDWEPLSVTYVGDADHDMIADDCDPLPEDAGNPSGGQFNDHDGDLYFNAHDNCPLVQNSGDLPFAGAAGDNNQADADGDGIGDSCDLEPDVPNGEVEVRCVASAVRVGEGGTTMLDPAEIEGLKSFSPCGKKTGVSPTPSASPPPSPTASPTVTPAALPEAGGSPSKGEFGLPAVAVALVFGLGILWLVRASVPGRLR